MDKYYDRKSKKEFSRESIIGLGEESFRKNYYPELQEKIYDLERTNARNRALISTIPDILLVSNSKGEIVPFLSQERSEKLMINEILSDSGILELLESEVMEALNTGSLLTKEFQMLQEGNVYYFEARFQKSETDEVLIIIRDITERSIMVQQLRDLAERDTLTELDNRRSFENRMDQYNGRVLDHIALISIDINGLKFINDTLGHLCGDNMIKASAELVSQVFSEHGHIARIGGDEFGIILENMEEKQVERMLGHLLRKVEEYNLNAKNYGYGLSLAYGYSLHKAGVVNMDLLYQEADNNMYQNKLLKKESIRSTFVSTFMKALEVKDYLTEGHVDRMGILTFLMGEALSLRSDQLDQLVLLTKFHDIGKIGIPDSILKKPARLTEDEWKVMRTHSNIGERIALETPEIKKIAHLILKHHEKWDGTGYPLGLAGEAIPIECRILAIVDSFDAMTNDRPYRKALPLSRAMEEIKKCSGSQFDPGLVEVFGGIVESRYMN